MKIHTNREKWNTIGLMGSWLVNNILYMFLNTFMVAYFITLTNYDYKQISLYYIMSFVFIILTFFFLSPIIKNKHQLLIFRSGILLSCFYILMVALLKEKIASYYIYLGSFYGIVQGFFWSAGHTLIAEHIGKDASSFVSLKSIIDKFLKIIFPLVFGISIEYTSFSYIAKIIVFLSLLQFAFSLFITNKQHLSTQKYSLKEFYRKFKGNTKLHIYYKMNACDGIVSYLLDTLITILIVMTFQTTLQLGFLTTLFSVCSILSVFLYQKYEKRKERVLTFGAYVMGLCMIFLLYSITKETVALYNLCAGIFLVLLQNNATSKRYTISSTIKEVEEKYQVEHQFFSELSLNLSRIVGYGILFIASLFPHMILFKILLFIVTLILFFYVNLMVKLKDS